MYKSDVEAIKQFSQKIEEINKEIDKIIVGQDDVINKLLLCIFSRGHSLLIGVPGLAKTLIVTTIAKILGLRFNRIQFTPDLMPSDIVGSEILDENRKFKFIKGPIFSNIILADEINRTPPKTQSALLEAMQEKSVSVAGNTYLLEEPFFVLATQNPIEQEGTYPLPEAQLDRFMFNIWLDYPSFEEEMNIVSQTTSDIFNEVNNIISREEIIYFQDLILRVPVNENLLRYVVSLVTRTRPSLSQSPSITKEYISWGAGPRASQFLILGAKANAIFSGKYSPDIEDIKAIAVSVLRHRIVINYKAEASGLKSEDIINELINSM